jgi:tetratricopeptide (TPR) repeat protein
VELIGDLGQFVAQALTLTLVFVAVGGLVRAGSAVWHRIRSRGRLPLIVRAVESPGLSPTTESRDSFLMVTSMLKAYIAEDVRGAWVIAPGTSNMATPDIPAEAPRSVDGWAAALYTLAVSARPAYHIVLMELPSSAGIKVSAQIVRQPGNAIIAARTFECADLEDRKAELEELVFDVGGFCVEQVQQQYPVLYRTPRWEHWANRGGYSAFRRGLSMEQRGATDQALARYQEASSLSLGNVTLALRRANLLEREHRHAEAIEIYDRCQRLWPESIEAAYRYSAACSNARVAPYADYRKAAELLAAIRRSLRVRVLVFRWFRARLPGRSNAGERAYWAAWFRPMRSQGRVVSRRSKRRAYLCATRLSQEIIRLAGRLQAAGDEVPRPAIEDSERTVGRVLSRRRIGWLAHYNGACFYSLCIELRERHEVPLDTADRARYTDLALAELAAVVRDPFNDLDPHWVLTDPDMTGLRGVVDARMWGNLLGVDLTAPARSNGVHNGHPAPVATGGASQGGVAG